MGEEAGTDKAVADEKRHFAVPPSITVPFFTDWFKEITATFAGKLSKQGVDHEAIKKAFPEMDVEIKRAVQTANLRFQTQISDYLYRKELEKMRIDYMGRALIREVEKHFPRDPDIADRLLEEPVAGYVPIQVAEGLIAALKSAHGTELIEEYERLCVEKAEQYRNPDDMLIDTEIFLADQDVKRMATDVCTRFRLLMHKKPEEEQKKWLLSHIFSSHSFRGMKRFLTDDEAAVIIRAFLKIG